ncbi:MAG: hypothetical protein IJ643_08700, partial [Eubacterium sp.]|nr:hypothetical protein [Eubacterium sp.]
MMKLSKKILAIALAVIMVLSVLPFSAFATEYEAGSQIDGPSLQTGDKIYLERTNIHALFGGAVLKAGQFLEFSSYKACQGGNKANGTVTSSDIYLSDNIGISDYYFKYVEDYDSGKCYVPIDKNGNVLEYILVLEKTGDFEPITFGTYVATVTSVAEVNGTQYATLEEAIAAANAGDTVKLLADIDFTVYPAFTRHTLDLTGVTLDLDGHTITGYNHSVVYVGDNFTIKNGNMVCVYDSVNNKKESYAAVIYPQEGNWQTNVVTDKSTGVVLENLVLTGGINCFGADVTVRGENTKVTGNYYYALWADVLATLTVEDGTFTSAASSTNGIIGACSDAGKEAYVYISGGDYTVPAGKNLVLQSTMASSQQLVEISGGTYNVVVPAKACAEGFVPVTEPNEQGKYTVAVDTSVAEVAGVKYESFEDALAAISTVTTSAPHTNGKTYNTYVANGEIKLLANVDSKGLIIGSGSDLTIDFNSYTLDIVSDPVGSNKTETIGLQLLKDSDITFKNGTLTSTAPSSEKVVRLIQNYSNLTFDNMNVGMTGYFYDQMTLSHCNGELNIQNGSTLAAPDFSRYGYSDAQAAESLGTRAFALGTFSSYTAASADVTDSTIKGTIKVDVANPGAGVTNTLTLTSGTLTGDIDMGDNADAAEVTKENTFTQEAPEGYRWVDNGDGTSTLDEIEEIA